MSILCKIGRISASVLTLAFATCGWAQTLSDFPTAETALGARVDMYDKLIRANHWNEGTIMPNVIFPPAGKDTAIVGSQENCPMHTGAYLASLSFRFAVTQDGQIRALADSVMEGILKLEQVTGEPGCVARSFNKTDGANWHEQAFAYPMEWRESDALSGYRWMGGMSTGQLTGLIFGVAQYWELCADDAHKKLAADFIDRAVGRCIGNNLRITDLEGKMTMWGNFCPDLPHEKVNALLILADLEVARKVTGKVVYEASYRRLLTKYKYDDEAVLSCEPSSRDRREAGDEAVVSMALYMLIHFEDNQELLGKYRAGLGKQCDVVIHP